MLVLLGWIVTLIYGAVLYFLQEVPAPEVFLSTTNFLFWWYIVASAILGIILILLAHGVLGARMVEGARKAGLLGGLLGILRGGVFSALILVKFAISAGCSIGGVYLLHDSLILSAGAPQWDTIKLIFGSLLLVIGLIIG